MAKFVLTAQLQLQAPKNVQQVVRDIEAQLNNINVDVRVRGAVQASKSVQDLTKYTNEASSAATKMGKSFQASVRRFTALAIATRAVSLFTNTLGGAIKESIAFERELIKIAQVTGKTVSGLSGLTNTISSLSTNLGVSSTSLLGVSRILAQTGLSARDTEIALGTLARTELAPTFDDITQTAEGAVAILNQFGQGAAALEAQLGSLNAVAGQFAVEAGDLVAVIRRTGGVFKSAGGDLNQLIALFTSVRATTRESAESIATGLRTIFTRIQRPETIDYLRQFGVELVDLEGKFVGPYQAIELLSKALAGLGEGDLTFIQIAEELGGFRQIGKVLPLIQQFAVAQDALKVAQEGQGSLASDAAKAQAALAIQIAKVQEEFSRLVRDITATPTFQIMADTALNLASALIKLADALKPIIPLLTAFAAIKAFQGVSGFLGGLSGNLGGKFNQGGKVLAFSRGGSVPGTGNRDTVPAMLTPGEFVIRKSSVQKIGSSNLQAMNKGGNVEAVGKRIGKIVTASSDTQLAHVGRNIDITPAVMKDVIAKSKDKKLAFSISQYGFGDRPSSETEAIETVKGVSPQLSDKEIKALMSSINLEAKRSIKLDIPSTYNQALRRGNPDLVAQKDLVSYVRNNQKSVSLLKGSVTNKEVAQKISSTPPKQIINGTPAYDVDNELDAVGDYIGKKFATNQIDLMFRGASKGFIEEMGLNPKRSRIQDRIKYTFNQGGLVQKFKDGGIAQRKVGYIDYDVIANPSNEAVVAKGMEQTGVKGIRLYADHLTDLATRARKDSSIGKLSAIYGVAGSGKTTLARGQGTDKGKLRETERFPILTPEDIQRSTEVIVLSSSVSKKKLDEVFQPADRTYTLSSTTEADKSTVASQRASRDTTGVGLEGRKPGTTTNVESDTAVGEALLSDRLGDKSVVLGRTESGRLRRKSKAELVEVIKKKIGFTWGGFSPMTAGHESIMDAAAAVGIPAKDFIYLVGSNEGIKNSDPSSYRTAIFDQDARTLLAKAGAGSRGATVLAKDKGFEVPQAFDVGTQGGRRQVVVPAKGSTVFAADKDAKSLAKYQEAGYEVSNIERTGGISGTQVRDLIMSGNMGQLQQVLSPNVYELISNNIKQIRNRANVLPEIIAEVKKRETTSLAEVESQIKSLGISRVDNKKVESDPEYAAQVDVLKELRKKRDKIKSFASFEPYSILAKMAAAEPEQYGLDFSMPRSSAKPMRQMGKKTQKANLGGQIQKFATGGIVPGTGNRDTVPATLQAGDFVIRKRSVESIGAGNLQQMAGYATGGNVDKSVPALLTPGEYVFSKEQAQKIGYSNLNKMNKQGKYALGGIIQKFKDGSTGTGVAPARNRMGMTPEQVAAAEERKRLRERQQGMQKKGPKLNKTFGLASLFGVSDDGPQDGILPETGAMVKIQRGVLSEKKAKVYENYMLKGFNKLSTTLSKRFTTDIRSKPLSQAEMDEASKKAGFYNAVGAIFEAALAMTGAPYAGRDSGKSAINQSIDFPSGLGSASKNFNLPSGIPTDATRTSGSRGKSKQDFLGQVERYLYKTGELQRPIKRAAGGIVPGVGNRDTVPATLQQGDFVIRKRSVQSIGAGNLQKMAGYNSGGKTTDVPALLTPGEFVFSKSQAQKVGYGKLNRMNKVGKYAKGGIVQKFASGTGSSGAQPSGSGSVGINIDTSGLTSAFESLVGSIDDIVNQLNSFKQSTQDVADANEKQVDSSKRVADADSDLERQYQKTMVSQARLAAFVGAAATGFTMLTPTIDETSGYMDYLMKSISELGLQLVAAYGIIERFQLLDPDKLQRVAGYLDSGLSSLGKKFTDLREAVNNPIQAFGQLQSSISASSAANVAESAASVESASADTVEAAASMAAAKADAAEAASGGGGFFSNLLKSSGFKQFLKIGAVATTIAAAFYTVNKAAADLAKRLKETAIEEGNIEEAGRLAAVEAGARNSAAGSATGAFGGAAIGAAIGSSIAPVIGTAIGTAIGAIIGGLAAGASDTFGEFVRTLFGGQTTKSIIAMSRASAAAANASKKLIESQEKVNKAMEKFRNGTATATDVMLASSSGIQAAAQARIEADKAVAENSKNLSGQFSSFFRYLGAWLTLGFVDTGAERNAKIESENKKITQEAEAAEKQAAAQSMQAINPLMRQVAAAGGSFEDFRRRMTATAKGTQIFNMIMKHSGEELRDSFNNLSQEAERTRAAFEAMNLGMRGVQGSASSLELEISNIFRRTDGSISGLESTIATLEAGITSAAESMSDDTWSSAVDSASGALRMLGADQQSIKKFEENMNAINAAQRTFADSFGEARQKLENEFLRGASQGGTVPQRQQALANAVADNLPAQIGDDVRERIRSAINNAELDDDQQRKLIAGDVSVLDDVLKELGETTLSQVIEPFKQLNNVLNERIAANDKLLKLERQLVDAKLKAIDVEIEAAELVAKYSDNSPFTEVNRREKIIEKGNIATEGLGLNPIVQGTQAEFETRNRQAQRQAEYVANTREMAAGGNEPANIAAQATIRTDEFRGLESNLERFVNAELATKRALIKSMEAEIKAIEAKTAAEKKATDNLLSGSYEQFVEQLAAEGAVMAAASGDPNLMRRFSRQDYGRGDKLLEDMQSDGVTNFMGRSMRSLRTDTRAFGLMAGGFSPNAAYARAGMGIDGARDKDGKFISPQIAGIASTMPGTANIDVTRAQGAVGEQERILAEVNLRLQKQMEKTNEEIAKNIEALGKNTDALNNNKDKDAQQTSRTTASDSEMASSRVYSDGCCEGVSDVRVTNTGEFPDNSGGISDLINGVGSVIKVLAPLGALKNLLSKRPPKPPASPSPRGLGVKPTSTMSRTRTPLSPDDIELPTKPRGPIIDAEFDVRPDPRRIPASSRPRALDAPDRPLLNGPEPLRLYAPETRRPTATQSNALTTIDDVAAPRPTVSQSDDLLALPAPRPAQVASEVVDAVEFGPVTPSVPQTIEDVLPDDDAAELLSERGLIPREQAVPRATSSAASAASSADEGASIFTRGREALNRFGDAAGEYVSRAGTRASEVASNLAGKVSPYIPQSVKTVGGYIGQGVNKVGEFAAKYAKPLAVADLALGARQGLIDTEESVGNTINNRGLDNRGTTERLALGTLTGNAAVGESFTNMALGMERGGTGDQIAATYEAMLSRGLAGATFGGPVGALVGAGSAAGGQVYKAMTLLGQEQEAARQAGAKVEGLRSASVDESGLDVVTRNLLGNQAEIQLDIKDAEAAGDSEKVAQLEKQLAEAQLSLDKRIEERKSRGGDLFRTRGRSQFSGTLTKKAVEEDKALQAAYLDKEMAAQTEYRAAQSQVVKREQEVADLKSQQIQDNKVAASTATSGTFDYRTGALQSNMFTPDIEASKAAVQSYEQKIQEAQNILASSENFTNNLPDSTDAEAIAAYVVNLEPQLEVDTSQLPANVQAAIDSELQNVETTAVTKVTVEPEPENAYDPQAERDFNLQASPEELKSRGIQEIYKEDQGDSIKAGDIKARTPEYETERTRILSEAMNITPSQYEEVVSNSDNALEARNAFAKIPGYTIPDMNQATPSSGYPFSDDLNTQFGLASQPQEIADKVIDGIREGDVAPDVSQTSTAISDVIPAPAAPGARVESPEAQVARPSAPEPMVAPTTSSDLDKALQQVSDVAVPESSLDLSEVSPQEVQSAADSLAASIGEKSVTPDAEASKSAAPGEEGKSKIEGGDPMKPQDAGSCCAETLAILKQILGAIKGIGQYDPSKIDYSPSLIGQSPLTQSTQTDTLTPQLSSGSLPDLSQMGTLVGGNATTSPDVLSSALGAVFGTQIPDTTNLANVIASSTTPVTPSDTDIGVLQPIQKQEKESIARQAEFSTPRTITRTIPEEPKVERNNFGLTVGQESMVSSERLSRLEAQKSRMTTADPRRIASMDRKIAQEEYIASQPVVANMSEDEKRGVMLGFDTQQQNPFLAQGRYNNQRSNAYARSQQQKRFAYARSTGDQSGLTREDKQYLKFEEDRRLASSAQDQDRKEKELLAQKEKEKRAQVREQIASVIPEASSPVPYDFANVALQTAQSVGAFGPLSAPPAPGQETQQGSLLGNIGGMISEGLGTVSETLSTPAAGAIGGVVGNLAGGPIGGLIGGSLGQIADMASAGLGQVSGVTGDMIASSPLAVSSLEDQEQKTKDALRSRGPEKSETVNLTGNFYKDNIILLKQILEVLKNSLGATSDQNTLSKMYPDLFDGFSISYDHLADMDPSERIGDALKGVVTMMGGLSMPQLSMPDFLGGGSSSNDNARIEQESRRLPSITTSADSLPVESAISPAEAAANVPTYGLTPSEQVLSQSQIGIEQQLRKETDPEKRKALEARRTDIKNKIMSSRGAESEQDARMMDVSLYQDRVREAQSEKQSKVVQSQQSSKALTELSNKAKMQRSVQREAIKQEEQEDNRRQLLPATIQGGRGGDEALTLSENIKQTYAPIKTSPGSTSDLNPMLDIDLGHEQNIKESQETRPSASVITSPIQITKPEEFDFDKPEDVERAAKGFGTARAPEGVAPTPTVSKLEVEQASRRVFKNFGVDQKIEAQKQKKPPIITGPLSEEALKQKSQQENIEKAEAKAKEQQENRIKLLPPTVSGGRGGDTALSLSEGIKQTYAPVKKQPGSTSDLNPMLKESAENQAAGNDYALEKVEETKPSSSPLITKKEPVEKVQKLQAQERSRQIFKYLKSDPKTEQLKQPKRPIITGQMSEQVLEQKKAQKSIQVEENRKQKSQINQESSLPASLQGGRGNAISMSESISRTTEPVRLPSGTLISGNPMNVNRDKSEAINNQQMSGTNPLDTSFDTGNLTASGLGGTPPSAPAPTPMPMSAPAPVSGPTLGTQFSGSLSSGSGGDFSEATTILTSIESVLISIEAKIANNPTLTSKNAGTVGNSAELTTDAFDRSISNLSRIFSDFSSGFNEALSRLESVEIDVRLQPVKVVVDFNGAGIVERLENYVKKELWREVQAEFSQWQIGDDGRLARSGGLRR